MLKTHSCGELRKKDAGASVTLAGWADRRRDHGGLIFVDLRDRAGIVQVVFDPEASKAAHDIASEVRSEYVLQVKGQVAPRPAGTENPRLPTGEIEVVAGQVKVLGTAKTPPFYINEDIEVDENLRLKYRYLDLRRQRMRENILLRTRVIRFMRDFLEARGFIDLETPILLKSTPEGARDYLVPSRLYPGKFYALPQSPQQVKQLFMVAGMEKYYQIARCFRDEDTRADRQPEFTQLDIEASFVEEEDIISLTEDLFTAIVENLKPELRVVAKPFPRLKFAEALERYGTDKPDLRFGLELKDLSDIVGDSGFAVFKSAVAEGGRVKGLCAPGCGSYTRGQLDELSKFAQTFGAQGLITMAMGGSSTIEPEQVRSFVTKYLTPDQILRIAERTQAKPGDLVMIVAGNTRLVNKVLDEVRREMGRRLNLCDPKLMAFAFITDFPLFTRADDDSRWESTHHPFTSPRDEDMHLLESQPEAVRAKHYDAVCNGYELAGGSIRIHLPELQRKVFHILGYDDGRINELFGHLLEAFEFGAPPHGGIAPGIDRFVMLLAGESTIREVIPFPKNQNAVDLVFDAPARVSQQQVDELHIIIKDEG